MFTPRPVLEAREWLKKGNPRKAGEVLLAVAQDNHRDIVLARHDVSLTLVKVARQEYAQQAFWACWEALQLAEKLAPLNGEDRVFFEQAKCEADRRQKNRAHIQELVQLAQKWLSEGRPREVIRTIEPLLDPNSRPGFSVSNVLLEKVLADARIVLAELENFLALIQKALDAKDFRAAWGHYQKAYRKFPTDVELNGYSSQIYGPLVEEPLARAEECLRAGQLDEAEKLLRQTEEFIEENPSSKQKFEQLKFQLNEVKRQRSVEQLLDQLESAIEHEDFNTAYRILASGKVPPDNPRRQKLMKRLVEAGASEQPIPKPVEDRRQPIALSVRGQEWLILSNREVLVGGRGSRRADLRISAPLQAIHASLRRDQTGYYVRSYCPNDGGKGSVLVNNELVRSERRLVHGDRIAWIGACGKCGEWCLELPVAGSLTARLRLIDSTGAPAVGNFRHVLLLDDVAIFSGQRGTPAHVHLPGFAGAFELRWTERGLLYELCGCTLAGAEDDDPCQRVLLIPSELEIDVSLSEAEILGQLLTRGVSPSTVTFTWKTLNEGWA